MASLTIRRLPEHIKEALRVQAARNKRSMEEEARHILETAVLPPSTAVDAYRRIREIVGAEGLDLPEVPRDQFPRDPFEAWTEDRP